MSRPKYKPLTQVKGDKQAWPLYYAERTFSPRPKFSPGLTKAQAEQIVTTVREWYNLPPIFLTAVNKPRWHEIACTHSYFDPETNELTRARIRFNLGRRPRMLANLLHELAHVVTDYYYGENGIEPHGRELAGVLTYLYDRFHVIPEDALNVIWRRYKVKHKSAVESSPRALKPMRKRRLACLRS